MINMKKKYIDNYALYSPVIIETINGDKFKGWLVPRNKEYLLLPFDDIWKKYCFKASNIKEITHMTNKVSISKLAKELNEEIIFNE